VRVFDAAVAKAYAGQRQITWMEFAGEKSFTRFTWLPDETVRPSRITWWASKAR
jgi:isocitrate dehydrogenase